MPVLDAMFRHLPHSDLDIGAFQRSVFINAEPVSQLLLSGSLNLNSLAQLPTCAPPWPAYWLEYSNTRVPGPMLLGTLVRAFPPGPEVLDYFPMPKGDTRLPVSADELVSHNKTHWSILLDNWFLYRHKPYMMGMTLTALDKDGRFVNAHPENPEGENGNFVHILNEVFGGSPGAEQAIMFQLSVSMIATAFMQCKNVILEDDTDRLKTTRLYQTIRPKESRGINFKRLVIEPMVKKLRSEGDLPEGSVSADKVVKALHLCRGHFKDYREKGLFGKAKGVYWWDHTVRGSANSGVVVKDYEVRPPRV